MNWSWAKVEIGAASSPCSPIYRPSLFYTLTECQPSAKHSHSDLWAQVAESRSWQLRKELPLEASSTSASPPIATHTMAKSLLMRRFISPLQQVTYSRGTLITAIAGGRNLPQQPGLPCSCDFKEHKLISRIPSL